MGVIWHTMQNTAKACCEGHISIEHYDYTHIPLIIYHNGICESPFSLGVFAGKLKVNSQGDTDQINYNLFEEAMLLYFNLLLTKNKIAHLPTKKTTLLVAGIRVITIYQNSMKEGGCLWMQYAQCNTNTCVVLEVI